eukprot:scaffold183994_cov29-Attheya_sp.AAC.1
MSVAILTVRHNGMVHVEQFGLSAPQSVKDHINKQMEELFPRQWDRIHWRGEICEVSGVPMYLLVSWVERSFGKLEH